MEYNVINHLTGAVVYTTDDIHKAKAMRDVCIDRYLTPFLVEGSNLNPTTALQKESGQLQLKPDVAVPDRS